MVRTQRSIEERKKRTHLLCQIGGTVEKVLDRPLVEEDVVRGFKNLPVTDCGKY